MNQRKENNSSWYSLGLGLLLCIAVLVVSTGTAYARYRTERTKTVDFMVQEPEQVVLGVMHIVTEEEATEEYPKDSKVFREQKNLEWDSVNGNARLSLAVANGTPETQFPRRNQVVQLRLLGTLGFWTGMEPAKLSLTIPSRGESLQAVPIPIEEGTALYDVHGAGWVYTFQGEEGELYWELPGDTFSPLELIITMEGVTPQEAALLQPQITAYVTD